MEFWRSVQVLVRRWYVVVPVLLVAAVIGAVVVRSVPPSYKASGSVVLLRASPASPANADTANPWQTVNFGSNVFAILLSQAGAGPEFRATMAGRGAAPDFAVLPPTDQSATLQLSATADTPEAAMRSYRLLVTALDEEAQRRQQAVGAPPGTWLTPVEFVVPTDALPQGSGKVTAAILIATLALVAASALAFAVDSLVDVRARRRAADDDERSDDGPDAVPDDGVRELVELARRLPVVSASPRALMDPRPSLFDRPDRLDLEATA